MMIPYRCLNFTGTKELAYGGLVHRRKIVTILYQGKLSESHAPVMFYVLYVFLYVCALKCL